MFELEIMITGYTIVVATASVVITKCIDRKQLKKYAGNCQRPRHAC